MNSRLKPLLQIIPVTAGIVAICWVNRGVAWTPMRTAGAALGLVGYVLWLTARVQLGNSFSVQAKATALVTTGLYSKIRSPIYVSGTIFIVGIILFFEKPLLLLALVVLIPMQIARTRNEARVLEDKFGDAYRAYRAKVWF